MREDRGRRQGSDARPTRPLGTAGRLGFISFSRSLCTLQGSVVRAIRRVEELLQQLIVAMRSVGDLELAEHFETASKAIRRDIIFAASLYL